MTTAEIQKNQAKAAVKTLPDEALLIFTERELRLVENCKDYAASDPAGLPGHNLLLIINKLDDLVGQLIQGRGEAELNEILDRLG